MSPAGGMSAISGSTGHMFDALRVLVGRELRMRYKGSVLGIVWAVISPLAYVAVLQFVFENIIKTNIPHFTVFMYTGVMPFTWFSTSILTSSSAMLANRDLVRTPFFPKALVPAVVTSANFLLYLLALPVLFGLMLLDGVPMTSALGALPIIWVALGVMTLGFSVLFAAIGVLVRDVEHLAQILFQFLFFLTPIFYDLDRVPDNFRFWMYLNPLTPIVVAHRDVTLYGRLPDWGALAFTGMFAVGLLATSLFVFRILEDAFIDAA